jgi:hypothetical protein
MNEKVRVLRILEYVGDRKWVEKALSNTSVPLNGKKELTSRDHPTWNNVMKSAIIDQFPEILEDRIEKDVLGTESNQAHWIIWGGWKGNHDKRIDGAKCSNCGCVHPIVRGSTELLSEVCVKCKSIMTVKEI